MPHQIIGAFERREGGRDEERGQFRWRDERLGKVVAGDGNRRIKQDTPC